jgi:hypothetical protein
VTDAVQVDRTTLTGETDFAALALDVLSGGGSYGSYPSDSYPLDWVFRACQELHGTPWVDRLSGGVAACLTARSELVRAQALVFFQSRPGAVGGERIAELVAGDRTLFAGVPDPIHPAVDLDWQLLATLAARVSIGDARATGLACAEALRPGKAEPVVGALCTAVPGWVSAHAEQIVRATPGAGATILISPPVTGPELLALARRIAPLCRADPRFETDVTRFVDDPELRQAILAAYHSGE